MDFKERLEERMLQEIHDSRYDNVARLDDAKAGARAALELVAEEGEAQHAILSTQVAMSERKYCKDPRVDCRWLRARAKELE